LEIEHHRDLAHEFPELKHRVRELKLTSPVFRHLYGDYQALDNEIHRIELDIETPSDQYTEELKRRRVRLKDRLYAMLTGRIAPGASTEDYVVRRKFRWPVDPGEVVRDWIARGYAARAFREPSGEPAHERARDTDHLLTVVEGRLEVGLNGENYVLEPGDELFIPRAAVYQVRNVHRDGTRWLCGSD
jgi:hypothetical protein